MASASTTYNDGTSFPFLNLPSELQHCVYRFLIPYIIRPRELPLEMVFENKDEQKPSIALFLINKQVHEEISYVLYQYSHFLISINSSRVACVALESSILWELDQTERMSIKLASSIRYIDIDLEWVKRQNFVSAVARNLRLNPLLEYVCEHLRAFRCLQTLTVRWNDGEILNSGPRVDQAIFILGPLEQLQADFARCADHRPSYRTTAQ